ncbi:relaxase/mobilization nuclease domain-containing protein [Croceibacterium ferulae]|uniref:relaxase/mobilization nuclease domain-containing protein n=1 Tax=Croceibacterium ferulae TaxID=1854641 RepID=UPI000EAEB66B|nr:relaxase/mobilization nuclease domain-containing protein [Croceibacterium ferulae]
MILKASQRGGGRDLAVHLLKPENEHVEVHEVRGFCSETVLGAFKEAQAIASGTRCQQYLFSVSLNPPETASVPVDAFERAIDRIEDQLGLTGQPRVIVFHEKEGRRHCHAVWSRIDAETMTARQMSHFKMKLNAISKGLYLEHGWELPRGFIDKELRDKGSFDLAHWQQCKRMGRDPKALKEAIQTSWAISDTRQSFEAALEAKGLFLARGDRRAYVAVTYEGEVLSLSRMTGQKTKDIAARLGKPDECRSVEETKQHIAATIAPKLRHLLNENDRAKLEAMLPLEAMRITMRDQHRECRQELNDAQRQRSEAEGKVRAARLRKGVPGLWDRLTGRRKETLRQNEAEAKECRARDCTERHNLVREQLTERRGLQRQIVIVRSLFAERAEELTRDLARQGAEQETEERSLSDSFNGTSGAESSTPAPTTPRILRGRSFGHSHDRGRPEL